MENYDIFISYSKQDQSFVHQLAHDLRNHGLRIWLDFWEVLPGDRLRDKVNEGINISTYVLVVLSPHSIDSPWVGLELDSGMIKELANRAVVVIPILVGGVDPETIPMDLRGKLQLDFSDQREYGTNLERILSRFKEKAPSAPYEYEMLLAETSIDLADAGGQVAHISKRKRMRVLSEKMVYNYEEFYGDGKIDSFEAVPGGITSLRQTLGKIEVITDFGKVFYKDEEFEQTITCTYHGSFLNDKEYWITWIAFPTRPETKCRYSVTFPIDRPPTHSRGKIRTGTYERDLEQQPVESVIDGRTCVAIDIVGPTMNDYYKLEWEW